MMLYQPSQCLLLVALLLSLRTPAIADEHQPTSNERPTVRADDKYGLNFYYAGDKNVKQFLNTTPCVAGVWWKFHKEDDKHWYGELHYPTENTGTYETDDPKDRSPQY